MARSPSASSSSSSGRLRDPGAAVFPVEDDRALARRSPFQALVRSSWVQQAIGIVMAVRGCSPEEASDQLVDVAASHQLPVRAVARQLVAQTSGALPPPTSRTVGRRGENGAEVVHRYWGWALEPGHTRRVVGRHAHVSVGDRPHPH